MKRIIHWLTVQTTLKHGVVSVVTLGILYALLLTQLANDGHQPSAVHMLPTEPSQYYRMASYYIAPLFFVLCTIYSGAAFGTVPTAVRQGSFRQLLSAMACCYSIPMALCLVAPEIAVYNLLGHNALKYTFLYGGVATVVLQLGLSAATIKRMYDLSTGRAFITAVAAYFAQAIPASLLIR